jgi:hypothetical protein
MTLSRDFATVTRLCTHVILLVNVSLNVSARSQLSMEVIEHSLDLADSILLLRAADLVLSVVRYEVEQFRVEIIESLGGTNGGGSERDESTGGQGVFGSSLVKGSLVVVGNVVEEGVRLGAEKRGDSGLSNRSLANRGDKVFLA